jgi:hypothetical protein
MFKFIGIVCIATVLLLPLKDGNSISDAAKNEVVQQIPPALDILAARHPLKVGLLRGLLNDNGQLDSFVESYARASMDQGKSPGLFDSYSLYYSVMFNKDKFRAEMADSIEQQFGLN